MCLAIPMQVCSIEKNGTGICEVDGIRQEVDLSLVSETGVGDHVIVHAGYAIEKLDEEEARQRIALFADLAAQGQAQDRPVESL